MTTTQVDPKTLTTLRRSATAFRNKGEHVLASAVEARIKELELSTPVVKRGAKEYPPVAVEVFEVQTPDGPMMAFKSPDPGFKRRYAFASCLKEAAGKNSEGKNRAKWNPEGSFWEVPADALDKVKQVYGNFFQGNFVDPHTTEVIGALPAPEPRS